MANLKMNPDEVLSVIQRKANESIGLVEEAAKRLITDVGLVTKTLEAVKGESAESLLIGADAAVVGLIELEHDAAGTNAQFQVGGRLVYLGDIQQYIKAGKYRVIVTLHRLGNADDR